MHLKHREEVVDLQRGQYGLELAARPCCELSRRSATLPRRFVLGPDHKFSASSIEERNGAAACVFLIVATIVRLERRGRDGAMKCSDRSG